MRTGWMEVSPSQDHGGAKQKCAWFPLVQTLLVVFTISCTNPINGQRPSVSGAVQLDASPTPDLPGPSETPEAGDDRLRCAKQTVDSILIPVRGTVRGPTVEGEVCGNGMGTFFLGPEDRDGTYNQTFFTNTRSDAPFSSTGHDRSLVYGFLIRTPADAQSAVLTGGVGATAAKVGTYDSTTNCGWLNFEVTLPIPPGVSCPTKFGPCDPGCSGYGEMMLCQPAPAKLHYAVRPSASCETNQAPAEGSWVLTLTSVSPYIVRDGYRHHDTHGNLTATLVNCENPSDTVVLNLDF